MNPGVSVKVAVDAVGGDFAPTEVLAGVSSALAEDAGLLVTVVGPEDVVAPFAASHERATAVAAEETIGMHEHPANAVRQKKRSSIVVGCDLVKSREADAFFSAGNTGAAMAAATLIMGRVKGISRPAIATVIPGGRTPTVLLDVGAQADCRPEHLVQFAHMGAAYAETVLANPRPRIGLLNIGEEPSKGSQLAQEAHALMAAQIAGFVGNVEGRDIIGDAADVVVTDGFTGNVALKLLEGVSKALLGQVKAVMLESLPNKVAAAVLRPSMERLKDQLDPDTYGGAPLLGVDGVCIIGHGSSREKAVCNAIRVAAQAARGDLTGAIAAHIEQSAI